MRKHWFFELFNTGKKDNILEDPKSSIKQAYEMVNDGRIKDAKTICLLMKCQNKLM